jgi:enamine deaminase RidA (YjgF/YER057c/UK114 family)
LTIERWPSGAPGRSRIVAHAGLVWAVANATDAAAKLEQQVAQTLARLDASLREAGSDRTRLLSATVFLHDIADRDAFNRHWLDWIGPDPAAWPQRACVQAELAGGLLVEIVAVAAR